MFTRQQALEKLIEFKYAEYLTTVDSSLKSISPKSIISDMTKTQLQQSASEYINNLPDLEQKIDEMLILLEQNTIQE